MIRFTLEMTADSQVALDCYVRATAAGVFVDDIVRTVHSYEEEGLLEECAVRFWPDEIRLIDDTEETPIITQYRQFQAWADREGVSLEPAFTRRERTTLVSDDSDTVLVLPVVCLAIRVDGELVRVAPHTTGSTPYTVRDALADISSLSGSPEITVLSPDSPVSPAPTSQSGADQPASEPNDRHS
jgi:hypothetical protein